MDQISKRQCHNCCAFKDGECMNLVSFSFNGGPREVPTPTDTCPNHKTWDEDRRDDEAMARFRVAAGLPRQRTYLDDDTGGPDAR